MLDLRGTMSGKNRNRAWIVACALLWALPLWAKDADEADRSGRLAEDLAADPLLAVCGLTAEGDFDRGNEVLTHAVRANPEDPDLKQLRTWYDDWNKLSGGRRDLRRRLFDAHVGFTRKMVELELTQWAYKGVLDASEVAEDPKTIREADWVKPIVQARVDEAEQHYKEGRWLDAYRVFDALYRLGEDNAEFKEKADRCRGRARLAAVYAPDTSWKRQLENVDFTLAADVLRQIESDFVETPDFRKIVLGGLNKLLLLGTTPQLEQVFPQLRGAFPPEERAASRPADGKRSAAEAGTSLPESRRAAYRPEQAAKRTKYVDGIGELIAQCEKQADQDFQAANDRFIKAREVNADTLDLDDRLVTYEFLRGVMEELDSFSAIIWPKDKPDFIKGTQGKFFGVGIQIRKDEKTKRLLVVTPLDETPAYKAGIEPQDLIYAVDGEDTKDMDLEEAVRKITGLPGKKVVLTIRRTVDGKTMQRDVPIVRAPITIRTVKGYRRPENGGWNYMVDPESKIGYVRVTHFMAQTAADLEKAVRQLRDEGMKALVLDLRDNPGGLMSAAVEMADLFLDEGAIVSMESREGRPQRRAPALATGANTFKAFPMAVLINDLSASASEIVSGALQDHHRAAIVGERSFGKASVQNVYPMLGDSCYLKLTTAHYKVPSGRDIHKLPGAKKWGVDPNVAIDMLLAEEYTLRKAAMARDVIHGQAHDDEGWQAVDADLAGEEGQDAERSKPDKGDGADSDQATDESKNDAAADADRKTKALHDALEKLNEVIGGIKAEDAQLQAALLVLRAKLLAQTVTDATKHARAAAAPRR